MGITQCRRAVALASATTLVAVLAFSGCSTNSAVVPGSCIGGEADEGQCQRDGTSLENGLTNSQFAQRYHYYAPQGFMNDIQTIWKGSDGFVHLMYLQNAEYRHEGDGPVWQHLKTKDFVHYVDVGVAIPKFNGVWQAMASGSVVSNASGFFNDLAKSDLVAYFTSYVEGVQKQFVAYSKDDGRHFIPYASEAIMSAPDHTANFRDPFVTFDSSAHSMTMYLAEGNKVGVYVSGDGKRFAYQGATILDGTTLDDGDLGLIECPNLKTLRDPNTGVDKTVLLFGANGYRQNRSTGTYYMIGHLNDDKVFVPEQQPKRLDDGSDFYGANFMQQSKDQLVSVAWMGNWDYSDHPLNDGNGPTYNLGSFSLARRLSLRGVAGDYSLSNTVIEPTELYSNPKRGKSVSEEAGSGKGTGQYAELLNVVRSSSQRISLKFSGGPGAAQVNGNIRVRLEQSDSNVTVEYDAASGRYSVSRTTTRFGDSEGLSAYSRQYAPVETGIIDPLTVKLRILEDRSSIEFFFEDSGRCYSLVKYSTDLFTRTIVETGGDNAVSYEFEDIGRAGRE